MAFNAPKTGILTLQFDNFFINLHHDLVTVHSKDVTADSRQGVRSRNFLSLRQILEGGGIFSNYFLLKNGGKKRLKIPYNFQILSESEVLRRSEASTPTSEERLCA